MRLCCLTALPSTAFASIDVLLWAAPQRLPPRCCTGSHRDSHQTHHPVFRREPNYSKVDGIMARLSLRENQLKCLQLLCRLALMPDFRNRLLEFSDILEAFVDRSETYVGDFVEALQLAHH